jgi:hypothetical protein
MESRPGARGRSGSGTIGRGDALVHVSRSPLAILWRWPDAALAVAAKGVTSSHPLLLRSRAVAVLSPCRQGSVVMAHMDQCIPAAFCSRSRKVTGA